MTYAQLVQAIKDYTENTETTFVSQIDTFIGHAERRIFKEIDLNVNRKTVTASLTSGDNFITLPSDTVVVRTLQFVDSSTDRTLLLQKDTSFLNEYIVDRTTTGTPRYYSHWDDTKLYVVPAPSTAWNYELAYTYRPTGLSASNTTTWLGDNADDVLLNASLVEAYVFMKGEPDLIQLYEQKYQNGARSLLMEEDLRNRTDEFRTRSIIAQPGGNQ